MKRRIIGQKSAYTLTLPVDWVREHNIKAKDEVEVLKEGDKLVIKAEKGIVLEETNLVLEKGNRDYYRIMIENHYLKGYDILNIRFKDKKAFFIIQKIVSNLVGFEILEQKGDLCRIAATSSPTTNQFKSLLNRSFNIIAYTQERIRESLVDLSFLSLSEIESQTMDARRFLLFCTRALHKTSIVPRNEESFMHLLLERLILIQHNHLYFYRKMQKNKNLMVRNDIRKMYFQAMELFDLFREMFVRKNLENFAQINNIWEIVYLSKGFDCNREESVVFYHALFLTKLVFLISQPNFIMLTIET